MAPLAGKISKPKTQRGKRILANREPQLHENTKATLLIRGGKTSEIVTQALRDVLVLKKPHAVMLQRKNILRPFEDQTSLEFFAQKSDASLFVFGSHSKKRPNNLVLGSFYDGHVLDMIELGIERFESISMFKGGKCAVATKPCLAFAGDSFDTDKDHMRLKSLLLDMWRGPSANQIRLQGLEHLIQVTASDGKIYFRSYRINLKKSGLRTPRVELSEIGPSLDLVLRRTRLASDDLYKTAMKQPKAAKPKPKKNIGHDSLGTTTGRIHMQKQDLKRLQMRKVKALRTKRGSKDKEESGAEATIT